MNSLYLRLVNRHQQKPNFRFFSTDVGVGFGFLKYRDIGFGFRLPTRLYTAYTEFEVSTFSRSRDIGVRI